MAKYSREILPAPQSLVTNGKFNFGTYNRPINILNPLDADCFSIPVPKTIKNLRLKEWQAYEMGNNEYFIFTVLYKAKSIGLAQFFIYDKLNNKKFLYEKIVPTWSIKLPASLSGSSGEYSDKNIFIRYDNNIINNILKISIKVNGFKGLPDSEAEFTGMYDFTRWEPSVVSLPFSSRRGMYSHKSLIPMTGSFNLGENRITLASTDSFMIIDDHKGYYPYSSFYDWATGIERDKAGNLNGFNLTHNQIIDKDNYNENCLWLNGRMTTLPPVRFSRPDGPDNEWLIKDEYGMVDIKFIPEIQGKVDVNLIFLKTYYRGPLGKFNGFIEDSSGKKHTVDNYFGMGEEKRLRL